MVPQPDYYYNNASQRTVFDGKRKRPSINRKTVDYRSTIINYIRERPRLNSVDDFYYIQPSSAYMDKLMPPSTWYFNPSTSICTNHVHKSTNKQRCPVNVVTWTPEGRRLITGSSSGEFTLWNGLCFNFETILQAHQSAIRSMEWSHNQEFMISGDDAGKVGYWQPNMNNAKEIKAHPGDAVRDLSFSPTDKKFVTCSDDGNIKIFDFAQCREEIVLEGHGWDVKSVDWHPTKALLVSGSKDQKIKLWCPKSGKQIDTLHGHKSAISRVKWNRNGNWFLSASRDQLLKVYDIRNLKSALQTFRGHKKEVTACAWHPFHENFFVSAGSEGTILYWLVGTDEAVGEITQAHDSSVWSLSWHPVGHILCSGSNDHTTKFWCRNRPGDPMNDNFNSKKHE
eukprot:TRINITY_DN5738_c0_g1_i1.p1 TRINITY_DN5738_c0_g1~~TRINITY_DN5738_c0_g1_i1.p1  ORF type:complete len:396 (+),score=115.46 TRINITY_DN5738_c0_g1_i1:99-1286(+)